MKILFTNMHRLTWGGQPKCIMTLARRLAERGHDVLIGCPTGSTLAQDSAEAGIPNEDRFHFLSGFRPAARTWDSVLAQETVKSFRPDIIQVNSSPDHWLFSLLRLRRKLKIPVCRLRHNSYPVRRNLPNSLLNRKWTDHTIVHSEEVKRLLLENPIGSTTSPNSLIFV